MGDNMVKKAEYFILGNEGELYFLKKIFWEKQKGRSIWMCLKVLLYGKKLSSEDFIMKCFVLYCDLLKSWVWKK